MSLNYLPNGQTLELLARDETLTVGGVGGCHGPFDFDRPSSKLRGGFGHHHTRVDSEVARVQCIGLNKVAKPGNLVAFEMFPGGRDWRLLGEWP
jgi:hypothetical protein